MKEKYINAHMKAANIYAELSSCKRLKVGALVVKDNRIISIGYNGTPSGDDNCCEKDNVTISTVIHAESNAISKLARSQESSEAASMFITHAPCLECAKLIYQSGIKEVFYEKVYRDSTGVLFLQAHNIPSTRYEIGTGAVRNTNI